MPSTYTAFDATKPSGGTQSGPNTMASANTNDVALWYAVVNGFAKGFVFSQSGTGSATEEAQYWLFTNGAQIVRATNTWTSGYITAQVWDVSQDTGGTYANVCTQTFTYTGSGATAVLTGISQGSGTPSWLTFALGKAKAIYTAFTTHTSATGTGVHGLGSISTQTASAVAITGGNIDGAIVGATTQADVNAKTFRGKVIAVGNVAGSTAIDWSLGDYYTMTVTNAAGALTWSSLPAAGLAQGITLEITNPGVATTLFPGTVKWPGAVLPTRTVSGLDLYEFTCRDNSTVRGAQAQKDSR